MSGEKSCIEEFDEDADIQPATKKPRKISDLARKFQLEWARTLHWAEGTLKDHGKLHMVRCNVCLIVDMKEGKHYLYFKHVVQSHHNTGLQPLPCTTKI